MKISVVTVCYNAEKTIEQTIQSVVSQNYSDKEYIVIDGKSTDGTVDIIKKYSEQISFWSSESDNGIYHAMNKGISHVTGDAVAFLNSDDWYEPGTLEKVAEYFKDNQIDCLTGEVNSILNNHIIEINAPLRTEEDIHFSMIYRHPAFFAKTYIFDQIGVFNEEYKIAADYDLVLRMHNAGYKIMKVPDIFTNFRRDGVSAVQLYHCMKETREIALNNLGEHGEELRSKVEKVLNADNYYDSTVINLVCKEDAGYIKSLMGNAEGVYVWGAGMSSNMCIRFLLMAGVKIKGFIDSYKKKDTYMGYKVYPPVGVEKNAFICIGAEPFKDEIIVQLKKLGFEKSQYIGFSELRSSTLKYGKKKFSDKVFGGTYSG